MTNPTEAGKAGVTRQPYEAPQTSMERHLVELVEHLRNGTDSRSGFAQKVEAAQAHAFWLEIAVQEMREEIRKLERSMCPSLPIIHCNSYSDEVRSPMGELRGKFFDWSMEKISWRGLWNSYDKMDRDVAKRIKRRTYRSLLKLFRTEFEKTFTLNMDRLKP